MSKVLVDLLLVGDCYLEDAQTFVCDEKDWADLINQKNLKLLDPHPFVHEDLEELDEFCEVAKSGEQRWWLRVTRIAEL